MVKKAASGVLASLKGSTYRDARLVSQLAAALLDNLFTQPASDSDIDTARELIASYRAQAEFLRSLLRPMFLSWRSTALNGADRAFTLSPQLQISTERVDGLLRFVQMVGVELAEREIDIPVGRVHY